MPGVFAAAWVALAVGLGIMITICTGGDIREPHHAASRMQRPASSPAWYL